MPTLTPEPPALYQSRFRSQFNEDAVAWCDVSTHVPYFGIYGETTGVAIDVAFTAPTGSVIQDRDLVLYEDPISQFHVTWNGNDGNPVGRVSTDRGTTWTSETVLP